MNKAKIGLGVSIGLIVILVGVGAWFYTDFQNQINTLNGQVSQLQTDKSSLQSLAAPQLIKINLEETDVRSGTPYLRVRCVVVNVGSDTANNCKLHVILYQGSTIAKETDIILGSITGKNWTRVDQQVFYTGSALTDRSVTPTWTA